MKNVFVADLRGVELSDEQISRIEAAIQDIVLQELNAGGRLTAGKRSGSFWATHFPGEWLGIWINPHEPFPQFAADDIMKFVR